MHDLKTAKIIFEDEWILVLDKKAGVVVNRSDTMKEGTLQDDLAEYFGLGQAFGVGDRAGVVHRLDKETSGLLVVAKTQRAFLDLQAQFKARQVEKEYVALVHGLVKESEGSVEAKIERIGKFGKFGISKRRSLAGREARTDFEARQRYRIPEEGLAAMISARESQSGLGLSKSRLRYLRDHAREYTLLTVLPKTGRTHQIRIHLKSIGHPVVSDLIYGPGKLLKLDLLWCPRLFLHASSLSFVHPKTKKKVKFESGLPNELKNAILNLKLI